MQMDRSTNGIEGEGEIMVSTERNLHIQSVLYNNEPDRILRSIRSLVRAVDFVINKGVFNKVSIYYGDGSPQPIFKDKQIEELNHEYGNYLSIHYDYFGTNLGSARGHNRLAMNSVLAHYILILNPDVLLAPDALINLHAPFCSSDKVGVVEARQLPIEHPKYYDPKTGDTSWASTACALISKEAFQAVEGFDADTFFLYCDDVDFSWSIRLKGFRIVHNPSAVVFHDKVLSNRGDWITSDAENYYSAEAGLLMAYKWSRPDILNKILEHFENSTVDYYLRAAKEFHARKSNNQLPRQVDPDHKIGEFFNNNYGRMRFLL